MSDTEETEIQPVALNTEERGWLEDLPLNLALEKIQRNHTSERCVTCKRFIGNHSLRQMKSCLAKLWNEEEERG